MAQKTSGNVDACPVTKEIWEAREEAKKGDCGGQSVYHCLADKEGRKWERCVEKTRIKQGTHQHLCINQTDFPCMGKENSGVLKWIEAHK